MGNEQRINIAELDFRSDVKAELFILMDKIEALKVEMGKLEELVKENKADITGVANSLRAKIDKTEGELKDDIILRTTTSNTRLYELIKAGGLALVGGLIGHFGLKK